MPIELTWIAGVLIAGVGTLVLAIIQTDQPARRRR